MTFAVYPSLVGRNVFVSGGATGIGADIVRAFARNHAHVTFVDVQRAEGERIAAAVKREGGTALFLNCDVTDVAALQAAIGEARASSVPSRSWSTTPPMTSATPSPTSPPITGTTPRT